ncbi:MAG: hypothetical protein ABL962_12875 [Fimbriimonadaceae bacterium]
MLTQQDFARLIDGAAIDAEIDRLGRQGADGVAMASRLSRRINCTVDWQPLGPDGARYRHMACRGEAVVFWDDLDGDRVIKLRGMPENGYETTGFGCILGRNKLGLIELQPGTLAQAVIRESLCWEQFGFGCHVETVVGEDVGLVLAQKWIRPATAASTSALKREIQTWMAARGWESLTDRRDVSVTLRDEAWHRDGMGAFDVNETNFIKSEEDGELYPIDLIVWPLPE